VLSTSSPPAARFPSGIDVAAGGGPAGGVDFLDLTYGAFPLLVLAVLILSYLLGRIATHQRRYRCVSTL
jgi:hypothetical protein